MKTPYALIAEAHRLLAEAYTQLAARDTFPPVQSVSLPSPPLRKNSLLSPREAAEQLGVTVSTLSRWRDQGTGPKYIKLGRNKQNLIRYRPDDVTAFIQTQERVSTSK